MVRITGSSRFKSVLAGLRHTYNVRITSFQRSSPRRSCSHRNRSRGVMAVVKSEKRDYYSVSNWWTTIQNNNIEIELSRKGQWPNATQDQ